MKKIISLCLILALAACSKKEIQNKPVASVTKNTVVSQSKTDVKTEAMKLQELLLKHEEPSQRFVVSATKRTIIKGKKGTVIYFDPNVLVTAAGDKPDTDIEIELKELLSTNDLLRSGAQTVSDGKLLVSGGSYFISASLNKQPLQIKQGQSLRVEFPKMSSEKMQLFYGKKDSVGTMNWVVANQKFVPRPAATEIKKPVSEKDKASNDEPGPGFFTMINATNVVLERNSNGEKVFWNGAWRSAAEARALSASYTIGVLKMDSLQKDQIKKLEENFAMEQKLANITYEAVRLNSLGWINCDRFEFSPKTSFVLNLAVKDSVQIANVFMVYRNIKSVMQQQFYNSDYKSTRATLGNLPVGQEISLIAYYQKNGHLYAFKKNIVAGKENTADASFSKKTPEEFKTLISEI